MNYFYRNILTYCATYLNFIDVGERNARIPDAPVLTTDIPASNGMNGSGDPRIQDHTKSPGKRTLAQIPVTLRHFKKVNIRVWTCPISPHIAVH